MKKLNNYEKGFIEAFLDTDGYITIYVYKNVPRIIVGFCNNSKKLLQKVQDVLGINKNITKSKDKCLLLRLSHSEIRELLPQIKLVIKEEKRKIALQLLETMQLGANQFSKINKKERNLLINKFKSL